MSRLPKYFRRGLPLLAAFAISFPVAPQAQAVLVTLDGPTYVHFSGSATVRWDDNVFLQARNEESDFIFILAPGLELGIGAEGSSSISVFYRHDFHIYSDNSRLDGNYANLFLDALWSQPRLNIGVDASFQQLAQVTPDLRLIGFPDQLIERDYYRSGIRGEYEITELTSVASGVHYARLDYDNPAFSNRDTITVPVNFYYSVTPKVDLSVGYRYRHTDNDPRQPFIGGGAFGPPQSVPNYNDHYFNVGARGELAPKLIGEARAGYQQRQVSGASNVSGLSLGLDFSHFTTPKTTLLAGAYRDFESGGRGESITAIGLNLGARHAFSHLVSAQAGIGYVERDWDRAVPGDLRPDREDETFNFNASVTYSPNGHLDLTAGYMFRTNSSNMPDLEFDSNIVSLSAALRY